jgi:hypothetical protein
MQEPHLIINWAAIGVSIVAAFIFGGLWYGPILGKTWAKEMGFDMSKKPDAKFMRRAFTLQLIGTFLTTYVLAHVGQVWRPSVWGVGEDMGSPLMWAFWSAFFTWIGFYIPLQFSKVSWEMKSWKLFFINAGHDIINLMIISTILSYWR